MRSEKPMRRHVTPPRTVKPASDWPLNRRLFTVKEAAVYLALSPITLYHLVHRRQIPFIKLGAKAVRFDKEDLDWLIDGSKSKTIKEVEKDGLIQAQQDMVAKLLP